MTSIDRFDLRLLAQSGATNGQVPVWDDTAKLWTPGAGGGGGSSWPPGSPDKPPASPNPKDDEFNGTSTVTWSNTPTAATTADVNSTISDAAYLRSNGLGASWVGKLQPVPAFPFTITTKLQTNMRGNFQQTGIVLAPTGTLTTASAIAHIGYLFSGSRIIRRDRTTFAGSFVNNSATAHSGWQGPMYLKITVNSATSVTWWCSPDGKLWILGETAYNPGFTPGYMGYVVAENGTADVAGYFEFFRIT